MRFGHGQGEQMAVPVLMLQPFACQRRPAGRAAAEKPAGARIRGSPYEVPHALHAEHRVVDEERNRVDAVRGVRSAGSDEGRNGSGFGNAFLENLPLSRFLVVKQRVHVDRLVELTDMGVDADLSKQRFHAERSGLIRHDGHDELANLLVAKHLRQHPNEGHRGRCLPPLAAFVELGEELRQACRS